MIKRIKIQDLGVLRLMKLAVFLIASTFLVTGCQANAVADSPLVDNQAGQPIVSPESNQSSVSSQNVQSFGGGGTVLQSCLRELDALKRIHQKRYQAKSGDLNRVLTQAKSYMELRESLNVDTVSIMDAAYQFKISRTCNSVRTELTRTLLERLEAL